MNSYALRTCLCREYASRKVCGALPIERRAFTTSFRLHKLGPVPKMSGVSNPKLQDILHRFRENVVLPKHLAKNQQTLIYKTKYASILETDPIIANISGEKFKLKHIDVCKDVPKLKTLISTIIPLLKDSKDWSVIPNVLQSLKNIGFKITPPQVEKIIRYAGVAGRQNVILECLRRTNDTGIRLKDQVIVSSVFYWINYKAREQDESANSIEKSLSMAEQVLDMLEDSKYTGTRYTAFALHPRNEISNLLMVLDIAATRALKYHQGKDEDSKVAKLAADIAHRSIRAPPPLVTGELLALAMEVERLKQREAELQGSTGVLTGEIQQVKKTCATQRRKLDAKIGNIGHWLRVNSRAVDGLKHALQVLDPTSDVVPPLQEKLMDFDTHFENVKGMWQEVRAMRGLSTDITYSMLTLGGKELQADLNATDLPL